MKDTAIDHSHPPIFSPKQVRKITSILLCISPVIGMAVDLIAPSLPAIAGYLQVAPAVAKGVIAIYLLGYALGNFFSGFLTDALGRRKLLLGGLFCFAIASLLPVLFPTILMVLLARFLQGISIGLVSVVVRSIFSDVLTAEQLVRFGVVMAAMWGLGPVIGPVIGGYLQQYFGWQAGFCFFFLVTLILLITIFIIVPETHFNRHPLNLSVIKKNTLEVVKHRVFISLALMMGLTYSLLIVFNTVGPFLIQSHLHYSPVFYGHVALLLGVFFLLTTLICRILLKQFRMEQISSVAVNLFLSVALLIMLASYFFSADMVFIILGSIMMFIGCGFIFPLSMGKGLSLFRHIAGTATAIMFFINILITSLSSFLISFISVKNAATLMSIYFLLMLLVWIIYWKLFSSAENPLRVQ